MFVGVPHLKFDHVNLKSLKGLVNSKGLFKYYVIIFGGFLDPPPPIVINCNHLARPPSIKNRNTVIFGGMVWSDFVDFLTLSEHTGDFEVSLAGLLDAVLCIIKHSMMKILFNN